MADIKKFAEELVNLTVAEVQELAKVLKEEYGIEPAAAAAVAVAAYVLIKKYVDSKRVVIGNDAENYVSCSFCDDTFVSETVA